MSEDYTNTGGIWATKAWRGHVDIDGVDFRISVVSTNMEGKAPSHEFYIRTTGKNSALADSGVLFYDDPDNEYGNIATGNCTIGEKRYFLNVKESQSEKERAPDFYIKVKEMTAQKAEAPF